MSRELTEAQEQIIKTPEKGVPGWGNGKYKDLFTGVSSVRLKEQQRSHVAGVRQRGR